MTDKPDEPTPNYMAGTFHVVLLDGEWHVLFEPDKLKRHFLSVARFQDQDRAESYADMENMTLGDFKESFSEDVMAIPDLSRAPIKATAIQRPTKQIPDIDRDLSDFEKEVITDLPGLMKDYPYGMTVADIQEYYGVNCSRATSVIKTLDARGSAKKVHWPDEGDATNRLIPLDYVRPPMRTTEQQVSVLAAMKKLANAEGLCGVSPTAIGREAKVNPPSIEGILYRLEQMGFLEPVSLKPGNVFPASYRVVQQQRN